MESFHRTHPRFFSAATNTRSLLIPPSSSFHVHVHVCTYTYAAFSPVQRFLRGMPREMRDSRGTWSNGVKISVLFDARSFAVLKRGRGKGAQPFICLAASCRVKRAGCAPWHTLTVSTNFTPNFQLARTPADLHNILEIFYKISPLRPSPGLAFPNSIVTDPPLPYFLSDDLSTSDHDDRWERAAVPRNTTRATKGPGHKDDGKKKERKKERKEKVCKTHRNREIRVDVGKKREELTWPL